jgi:superfamily II DNA or RNA helicase
MPAHDDGVLVAPPGSGKTVCRANIRRTVCELVIRWHRS